MKFKLFLFLTLLSSSLSVNAQHHCIQLTKKINGKTKIFTEGTRLKIKTLTGEKLIGRFKIIDLNTIQIDDATIDLGEIYKIKKKSTLGGFIGTYFLVAGLISLPIGIAAAASADGITSAIGGITIFRSIAAITGGMVLNDFPINNTHPKWQYKIIMNE